MTNEKTCGGCKEAMAETGGNRLICRRHAWCIGLSQSQFGTMGLVFTETPACPAWVARPGAEAPTPNGWLPGRNAPKDGTEMLAQWGSSRWVAHWDAEYRDWRDSAGDRIQRTDPNLYLPIPPTPEVGE